MIIRRQHFLCVFKAHKPALTAVFHSFPNTVIGLFWSFWACNENSHCSITKMLPSTLAGGRAAGTTSLHTRLGPLTYILRKGSFEKENTI